MSEIKTPPSNKKYRDGYDQINWGKIDETNLQIHQNEKEVAKEEKHSVDSV